MSGGIFLIKDDKLVKREESAYDSEELLQGLFNSGDSLCNYLPRKWGLAFLK